MGPHYLHRVFAPESVAIIGATPREGSVGERVFRNMLEAGYSGELYPINPKYEEIRGKPCYPSIEAIGKPVEMVVVVTPAKSIPNLIRSCGEQGVKGAVVISAGFREVGPEGARLEEQMVDYARRYGMRIVGPNCLGVMRPSVGFNATFSLNTAFRGDIALVSQSGALCTSILDWATSNHIGFSNMISMGAAADIDFGEVLDYLAVDPETKSILLYIEGIRNARDFMSGIRVAARMKPVIAVKTGRHEAGSRAAMSHTGSIVGSDDVFDRALRRAGVVRVMTIGELFSAAEILSSGARVTGNRLAVVTNAGGPGVMAADCAVEWGVSIPDLDEASMKKLNEILPPQWSHNNPVDILGDAAPELYGKAVSICLQSKEFDGVAVFLTPQAMTNPTGAAKMVIDAAKKSNKPTVTCWMGQDQVAEGRKLFTANKIPSFETPESCVQAFSYLANHHRSQQLLKQVPGPMAERDEPDVDGARLLIEGAMAEGHKVLSTTESKALLTAFHIPTMRSVEVHSANEALVAAEMVGFPVAMKIASHQISHKSDVGGVRLNIESAQEVRTAYNQLVESVQKKKPDAKILGVTIEKMVKKAHGRELMIGVLRDPVFGPVVSFGAGGTAVEVMKDRSVAVPPLNDFIIKDIISQTRVAKLLGAFRNLPPVNMEEIENVLLQVSAMTCELPEIQELDINPLIVDEDGAIAVDARVVVDHRPPTLGRYDHMAIHPYPMHLESSWQLPDGTDILIRPIRPEDAEIEDTFIRNLSPQSKYFRFMHAVQTLTPEMLVRFTQIDYDREMAFVATTQQNGKEAEIAVGRYVSNPDGKSCEIALVVGDEWRGKGIGMRILVTLMEVAKMRGLHTMEGEVLTENGGMLSLAKKMGFSIRPLPDDPNTLFISKPL
jgi:acetyltransferase